MPAPDPPIARRALWYSITFWTGSDIVEAFTYNGHCEKMRVIGKEDLLEPLNRAALRIARKVADARPGNLMAGNISNANIWDPADGDRQTEVRGMFEEMVGRHTEASRYSEKMQNHFMYGDNVRFPEHIKSLGDTA